jgi:RNA polymerase sigma-70 factor (ECF subfamily)
MTDGVSVMSFDGVDRPPVQDLVRSARAGDEDAFGSLVESCWSDLVRLARGILASDQEAEDVVQESFVHAWKRLWMLRRPRSFEAWMRRIVTRRCLTRVRRRRTVETFGEREGDPVDPGARRDVEKLLASLAPRQRSAVYLTWILGYSDSEVGTMLGIRPATVRVHRHRGIEKLKRLVGGENGE